MKINDLPLLSAIDNKLDDLLVCWHRWQSGYRLNRGYSKSDATCRDYDTPTHWDRQNGALEGRFDELQARAVNACMDRIPNAPHYWRTALAFEARNLASAAVVWSSPVLPRTREEREILVLEARTRLLVELRRAGLFE